MQYGVCPEAIKQIKLLLQSIYAEAMKTKQYFNIKELDSEDSDISEL
jgi:hypothetical protein